MSLRSRVFLVSLLVALLPFALIALGLRRETAAHIAELDRSNLAALTQSIETGVAESAEALTARLSAVKMLALDDNELRSALLDRSRTEYLVDYAPRVMALTGLTLLQLHDDEGRILSSGQFRNDYGRIDTSLPNGLRKQPGPTLVDFRTPLGTGLALATEIEMEIGGERYVWVGGVSTDPIARGPRAGHLQARLWLPDAEAAAMSGTRVGTIALPYLAPGTGDARDAAIEIWRTFDPASQALHGIDRWFTGYLILAALGAGALALAASNWVSRPLRELAEKTTKVHLRRYRVRFESDRQDEVGELTRFVGGMVDRLQISAVQLQDAERRATLGELARQVHHDVKNGVTPIRNVVRHLSEIEHSDPASLARVFRERSSTLESSLAYLEELAANFARLTPRLERRRVDVNDTLRQVGEALPASPGIEIRLHLASKLPAVLADPLGLRRIVENLARNAVDAAGPSGAVTISSSVLEGESSPFDGSPAVAIAITDTGPGLSAEERARIFQHFYTTKPAGTGLGLSIVKRLVADFDGALRIESEPGKGSTFRVILPAATETLPAGGAR